jgi:hypothetical protein
MAVNMFADVSGIKRIEIPEMAPGFYIEVRQELSVGEKRAIFSRAFKGQVPLEDGKTFRNEYDMREVSFGQVSAYLHDWSEKKTAGSHDAVRALTDEAFALIEAAVTKHIESLEKNDPAVEAKKRSKNDAPISPSAAA